MNKDIAEKMEYQLRLLGWCAGKGFHRWKGFNVDTTPLIVKQIDRNTTRFCRPGYEDLAYMEVSNVSPSKISNTVFHKPLTINKQIADAYSSTASNTSDSVEMTRSYEISEASESTVSHDVGASVTVGIRQQIDVGGEVYGAKSETELSLEVAASFNKGWSYTNSSERSVSTEITVPPKTRTTLTATKSVSTLKQDIDYTADLEFSILFQNQGHLQWQIESQADLKRLCEGNGYPGMLKLGPNGYSQQRDVDKAMHELFNQPSRYKATWQTVINATYTDTMEFSNAVTGDVVLTSEKL